MKPTIILKLIVVFLSLTIMQLGPVAGLMSATVFAEHPQTEPQIQQSSSATTGQIIEVAPDRKLKIKGVIVTRELSSFTLRDQSGSDLRVRFVYTTKLPKKHSSDDLLRGLFVEVKGRGDTSGALLAEQIKFSDKDLIVARGIQSQLVTVEQRLGQTETRLNRSEQSVKLLADQTEELIEVSNLARGGARAAQATADKALAEIDRANERISALDDYEVKTSVTINFKAGKAVLLPQARTDLDRLAAQAKSEKGFIIEVSGFASTDGPEEFNRLLSQRRSEAVTRYLVEKHGIPLRRILAPFGYGESQPVADNSTRQGRTQNRRAEVKLMVNQGVATSISTVGPKQPANSTGQKSTTQQSRLK
jgi:outer membrane protein OmpA-like peptidoglycan-associated protein